MGGTALREWAATAAEHLAEKRLAGQRTAATASDLVTEVHDAAMHAMLPLAQSADLDRVVACPEAGQGIVGVTVPEVLAIVAYIRKHKSRAEEKRIYESALENAKSIAARGEGDSSPVPCALQGPDCLCRAFRRRPLGCRPLHASWIRKELDQREGRPGGSPAKDLVNSGHEEIVADGMELGLTRALKSANLDANIYELNSALATALGIPDAAERWAKGEDVLRNCLRQN